MFRSINRVNGFALILLVTLAIGCAHRQEYSSNSAVAYNEKGKKGLQFNIQWLKHKTDTIDMRISLTNNYPHTVHFNRRSVKLKFNGIRAKLKRIRPVELYPDESRRFTLIFDFEHAQPKNGMAVFRIDPLYKGELGSDDEIKLRPLMVNLPVGNK